MSWREVFKNPPSNSHILQFYGEPSHQIEAAAVFVAAGLKNKEKVYLGDTKERLEQIVQLLRNQGIDSEDFEKSGHLTILDSEGALQGLARFGRLNEPAIHELVDMTRKEVETGKYSQVRFCMRFAPQVAEQGESDLAASMEDVWQMSTRKHPSVALCAYSMKNLTSEMDNIDYWKQLMKSHTFILSDVGLVLPLKPEETSIPYMEYQSSSRKIAPTPTIGIENNLESEA